MPLVISDLQGSLEGLFAQPGADAAECGQAWADAMGSYASGIVPPTTMLSAAQAALAGSLAGAFSSPNAVPGMESAFASFATTIGTGMAPAFAATPPAGPVGFALQFAGPHPESHSDAASQIAALIDTWMRTGTATPSGGGPPVPWS